MTFTYLRDETFGQNELAQTVKIFRCEPWAAAFELLPAQSSPTVEFVAIPAGRCFIGSLNWPTEEPPHLVTVAPFLLSRTPVTQGVWDALRQRAGITSATWVDGRGWLGPMLPIHRVSWVSAEAFARWCGMRLPSEAEWEYACRAGTKTPWLWGDDPHVAGEHAWHNENAEGRVWPVATKRPNGFGLFDMAGNVWEWVADAWHDNYSGAPVDGQPWLSEPAQENTLRVVRGGGFRSDVHACRCATRLAFAANAQVDVVGFRVAAPMI